MNLFGKIFRDKEEVVMTKLPIPTDNADFFEAIKVESERYWSETDINPSLYGYQVQKGTKWKPGLTKHQINDFEKELGFVFPKPLSNFYLTMNGLDKPGINVFGSKGEEPQFQSIFYSYPDDLALIKEYVNWVYTENNMAHEGLIEKGVSRIFPVCGHRFILVEEPTHPILSMYGDDVVYWSESLSKLLANEIFDNIGNVCEFESAPYNAPKIKFWVSQ